ncbi:short-chain dehydrogenase reductase family [Colletotrichum kahawae]|uniref:Short-chain dehydrogenase reductase family n=1 Tax=Colletotrichum kahawae TaxID=34407 RepID=A0AAD9YJ27_COLKA|nr:short-chain dehydrogenase reductase family [Colletotrichum kahawae]
MLILADRFVTNFQNLAQGLSSHPEINVKVLALSLLSFAYVRQAADVLNSWDDIRILPYCSTTMRSWHFRMPGLTKPSKADFRPTT